VRKEDATRHYQQGEGACARKEQAATGKEELSCWYLREIRLDKETVGKYEKAHNLAESSEGAYLRNRDLGPEHGKEKNGNLALQEEIDHARYQRTDEAHKGGTMRLGGRGVIEVESATTCEV
jgi:hypothetical protein